MGQLEFGSEPNFAVDMQVGNIWASLQESGVISWPAYLGESLSECFLLLAEHRSPMPKQKSSSQKCWLHARVVADG